MSGAGQGSGDAKMYVFSGRVAEHLFTCLCGYQGLIFLLKGTSSNVSTRQPHNGTKYMQIMW